MIGLPQIDGAKAQMLLTVFCMSFLLMSCSTMQGIVGAPIGVRCIDPGINSVTSAHDGRHYIFSYCNKSMSIIAIGDYWDNAGKVILVAEKETRYERPIATLDGKKIVFISRRSTDKSTLYAINVDGTGLMRLTNDSPDSNNIMDIALSRNGETIYYVNSNVFTHYSPIARSAPHEQDIYSLSLVSGEITRLSFKKKYALSGIAISPDGGKILSKSEILELDKEHTMQRIEYSGDSSLGFSVKALVHTSDYPLSTINSTNEMILSSGKALKFDTSMGQSYPVVKGYGLYLVRIPQMVIIKELIYLPSYLDSPTYLEADDIVLFIRNDKVFDGITGRELWAVRRDGSGLRKVDLNLPVMLN